MSEHQKHNDEYNIRPEHTFTPEYSTLPEYTPVYPDITFFKESSVTTREENIFSGQTPPGETAKDVAEERKEKRSRFNILRNLLGTAARGGAIALAAATVVAAVSSDPLVTKDEPGEQLAEIVNAGRVPAFTQQYGYSPDEFSALWDRDPDAPHAYDILNPTVLVQPTCTEGGKAELLCLECGVTKEVILDALGHDGADPVRENEIQPTCTEAGYYESVIYCNRCGAEVSRTPVTVPANGHTAGPEEREDVVDATCTEDGSYTEIYHCTVCGDEISRRLVTIAATGHTPGDPAYENVTATCTQAGSYSEVTRCTVCGEIISQTRQATAALGHITATTRENIIQATCLEDGSYEEVTVCTRCGEELSRNTVIVPAAGEHTEEEREEVIREATCLEEGEIDIVIYCSVCGEELSRETIITERTDHDPGDPVEENRIPATCTSEGSVEYVTYCKICGEELSRDLAIELMLEHDWETSYEWIENPDTGYEWELGENKYRVIATAVCRRDSSHTAEEEVQAVMSKVKDATCTEAGEVLYTAEFSDPMTFETQTRTEYTEPLGHVEGQTIEGDYLDPTCTEEGYRDTITLCAVCGEEIARLRIPSAALGHNYDYDNVEYAWADDHSSVTATTVCLRDGSHVLTDTAQTTENILTEPGCETTGLSEFTATFSDENLGTITEQFETAALGHEWGAAEYEWNDDNTVTARKTCTVCGEVYTETAEVVETVVKAATCEESGEIRLTATFSADSGFEAQTDSLETEPIGHDWGEPEYEWEGDNSSVTARIRCLNDSTHGIEEVAETYEVDGSYVEPTCSEEGSHVLRADFNNQEFTFQEKTVAIPKLDHTPGEPVIIDDDNYIEPTCEEAGQGTQVVYCEVCEEELSREVVELAATGHEWGEPEYEWDTERNICIRIITCENDPDHIKESSVSITYEETTPAICEEGGTRVYTAVFTDDPAETVTHEVETDPLGHDYENGVKNFVWADDNSTVTGYAYCANNDDHMIEETAETSYDVVTEATCEAEGEGVYTATFDNEVLNTAFEPKSVAIEKLEHTPGQAVVENHVEATCTEAEHYDEVIRCTVCNEIISSETITVGEPLGHEPGETQSENQVDPTCTEDGSHDMVTRCIHCGEILETTHVIDDALGHYEGKPVVENAVDPDGNELVCGGEGSYDIVVYCETCGEEVRREHHENEVLKHDWGITTSTGVFDLPAPETEIACTICGEHAVNLEYHTDADVPYFTIEINMEFLEAIQSFEPAHSMLRMMILAEGDDGESNSKPYARIAYDSQSVDYRVPVPEYFRDAVTGAYVDSLTSGDRYRVKLWINYPNPYGDIEYTILSNMVTIGGDDTHTHTPGASVVINAVNADNGEPAKCGEEAIYDLVTYCSECGEIVTYDPTTGPLPHNFVVDETGQFDRPAEGEDLVCDRCGLYAVQLNYSADGETFSITINDDFSSQLSELGQELSSIFILHTDDTGSSQSHTYFYVEQGGTNTITVPVSRMTAPDGGTPHVDSGDTYYVYMWVYDSQSGSEYTITSNTVTIP